MLFFIVITLYTIIFTQYQSNSSYIVGHSENALMDASDMTLTNNTLLALDGAWNVLKEDNSPAHISFFDALLRLQYQPQTFQMRVLVPEKDTYYTILTPQIFTDYSIHINGELLYANGQYAEQTRQFPVPTMHTFYAQTTDIEITLKVTNVTHYPFSSLEAILFGTPQATFQFFQREFSTDVFLCAISFIVGIYYFIIYHFTNRRKEYLTFGLLCFASLLRLSLLNANLLAIIVPNLPLVLGQALRTASQPSIVLLIMIHIKQLYTDYCPMKIFKFLRNFLILYTFLSLIIPVRYYMYYFCVLTIILFLTFMVELITLVRAMQKKEPKTFAILIGLLCLIAAFSLDTYTLLKGFSLSYFFAFGFNVFLFIQVLLFLRHNAEAYAQESELNRSYMNTLHQLKREETNFLSSQLKPHFLFNTLNIISGYAIDDAERSKKITAALTVYLKQLFEHDNLNEMNLLENEIELVKAFGYIELERFPNLTIHYDFPEQIPHVEVPSLLLRPLLENAVNHGIRKRNTDGSGNITISITQEKQKLHFSIRDDGAGCDEKVLERALNHKDNDKFHSLYHIQYRLRNLYQENIICKSVINVGTVISFQIPINAKEENTFS